MNPIEIMRINSKFYWILIQITSFTLAVIGLTYYPLLLTRWITQPWLITGTSYVVAFGMAQYVLPYLFSWLVIQSMSNRR